MDLDVAGAVVPGIGSVTVKPMAVWNAIERSLTGAVIDGLTLLTALAQAGPRNAFYLRMTHWAAPDSWHVSVDRSSMAH